MFILTIFRKKTHENNTFYSIIDCEFFYILTEQLQVAQKEIQKAEDKIELLRQEKLFIIQYSSFFYRRAHPPTKKLS